MKTQSRSWWNQLGRQVVCLIWRHDWRHLGHFSEGKWKYPKPPWRYRCLRCKRRVREADRHLWEHLWWWLLAVWRHRWYLAFYAPWNKGRPGHFYLTAPWRVWVASVVVGWPLVVVRELYAYMMGRPFFPTAALGWLVDLDYRFNTWADERSTSYSWISPEKMGPPPFGYEAVGFHVRSDLLPPRDPATRERPADLMPKMFVLTGESESVSWQTAISGTWGAEVAWNSNIVELTG